jgi:ABC-2 type transport system permease protein
MTSLRQLWAIAQKECWQLLRDRLTLALLLSVPIAQVLLFGFAIELNPKHWPAAWVHEQTTLPATNAGNREDERELQEAILARINAQGWLRLDKEAMSAPEAKAALIRGDVRFILYFPPTMLPYLEAEQALPLRLEADASDPYVAATVSSLVRELQATKQQAANQLLLDTSLGQVALTVDFPYQITHGSGAYLVPSLSGVILTLTLTLMAAFAFVREQERGTWLGLLSAPISASVIVVGKLLPYFLTGCLLLLGLNLIAIIWFHGAWASAAQVLAALFFMLGQLGLGVCISLLARTQMQAMQMGVFFYLPSILLSGFMFPFHSMPLWARVVGEALPLTHFLRVLRADLFRNADAGVQLSLAGPIFLFALVSIGIGILGYRRRMSASFVSPRTGTDLSES